MNTRLQYEEFYRRMRVAGRHTAVWTTRRSSLERIRLVHWARMSYIHKDTPMNAHRYSATYVRRLIRQTELLNERVERLLGR